MHVDRDIQPVAEITQTFEIAKAEKGKLLCAIHYLS